MNEVQETRRSNIGSEENTYTLQEGRSQDESCSDLQKTHTDF